MPRPLEIVYSLLRERSQLSDSPAGCCTKIQWYPLADSAISEHDASRWKDCAEARNGMSSIIFIRDKAAKPWLCNPNQMTMRLRNVVFLSDQRK